MEAPVGSLILQQKWEEVAKYVFQHIFRDMPKNDRFTLGADIRSLVWEIVGYLLSNPRLPEYQTPPWIKSQDQSISSQVIDFVGYRHWIDHILPRKRNTRRAVLSFRKISRDYALGKIDLEYVRPRVASFCGMMKHCDAYRTSESVLSNLVLSRHSAS